MLLDAGAVCASSYLAFYLRFDGDVPAYQLHTWRAFLAGLVACRIIAGYAITRYRLHWRFTSLTDLWYVAQSVVLGSLLFTTVLAFRHFHGYPRSVLLLEAFFTLNLMMALRLSIRVSRKFAGGLIIEPVSRRRRVLVVGAGDAGQRIVRQMKDDLAANLVPIGFLDDDPAKLGRLIHGVAVLGPVGSVEKVSRERNADQILIAIPSLSGAGISAIVRECACARADLTILPSLPQLVGSGLSPQVIRKVSVEDLLERSPIQVDMEVIAAYTTGQRILVTGAGGSIGSELCRQIVALRPESLVLLGQGENSLYWIEHELRVDYGFHPSIVVADVRDRHRLEDVFRKYHPTVIFHAAAHKHVPMMEDNPEEAVRNNVFGTQNLAELSMEFGVRKFVFISTDKAVNPTSVMGTTKRVAEMIVQSLAQRSQCAREGRPPTEDWAFGALDPGSVATTFTAVRFGNVLGSNGSVVPTMERQIARGGPVTVTHPEMTRYFMTIPEAVQLVIQAGGMGKGGEVFVLDMGKPVKIMDLAWNLIRLSGLVPNVDIKIEVTGTRPGEKLYEEVLTAEEGTNITSHQKIHVAKASAIDHATLRLGLVALSRAAYEANPDAIKDALLSLVPTYQRRPQ